MNYLINPLCDLNNKMQEVLRHTSLLHGIVQPFRKEGELFQYNLGFQEAGLWNDDYETVGYHKIVQAPTELGQRLGTSTRYKINTLIRFYCITPYVDTHDRLFYILSQNSNIEINGTNYDKLGIIQTETGKTDMMEIEKHVFYIEYTIVLYSDKCIPCPTK